VIPPASVLAAFGATSPPRLLPGGRARTWQAGGIVLKPSEGEQETIWRCGVLAALPEPSGFRIARPLRSRAGAWLAAGWEAATFVPGAADQRRVDEVIRAGSAFHAAVAAVPRPPFLDTRQDPWSYGDRLAWNSAGTAPGTPSALLAPLLAARRPVRQAAQIVHGDLLGNVLFADGLPPAIIDWSAYWRPPAWASAVAVVDALCWHGVGADVVGRWAHLPDWRQLLIRALIYRIATSDAAGRQGEPQGAYRPVIDLVLAFPG
jgi:uncharacterized protein (TIGR02569 family)